jgi:hypothetical protein
LPADYSGICNVTDSQGHIVSRRYVGEPRFPAILSNESEYPILGFALQLPRQDLTELSDTSEKDWFLESVVSP